MVWLFMISMSIHLMKRQLSLCDIYVTTMQSVKPVKSVVHLRKIYKDGSGIKSISDLCAGGLLQQALH